MMIGYQEKIPVRILCNNQFHEGLLELDAGTPDEELVTVAFRWNRMKLGGRGSNYFEALCDLRGQLEPQGVFLCCKGSLRDAYPSPLLLSSGEGRLAYRLLLGRPARKQNLVDIFSDAGNDLPVSVLQQRDYYVRWLESISG